MWNPHCGASVNGGGLVFCARQADWRGDSFVGLDVLSWKFVIPRRDVGWWV